MANAFRFEEIGLETRDRRVYEALVASPQSSLRKIAADTGINRGSVYESMKKLAEQGLVGSIEVGKQRRYTASNPEVIIELLKERQEQAAAAEMLAKSYIANLPRPDQAAIEAASFATFYEDHEGVAAILRDVLATCREQDAQAYRVISTKRVRQYLYHNFPNFTQRRIAEGISVRVIGVGSGGSTDELSERRELPATRGEAPNCYTLIFGDKTALITMNDANVLSAIVINNPGVTHLQKELFDHLWQTL
ncbi:winged helix-turn-helix transcriptional regulator [Candidatus Saccharibacteria bacterium]|nr:MAG: winged helix-turn-helix transcriptional regulator [Candidatus Saccharibacteria bacterium]